MITKFYVQLLLLFGIIFVNFQRTASLCAQGCQCSFYPLIIYCLDSDLLRLPTTWHHSLTKLTFTKSELEILDDNLLLYPKLTELELSYNKIKEIPDNLFAFHREMESLDMDSNKISTLTNQTFTGLTSLTLLNLNNNLIKELTPEIFAMLLKLGNLNLNNNKIQQIDPMAFTGLTLLSTLYLNGNQLKSVPVSSFKPLLEKLMILGMGANNFKSIPDGIFEGFNELIILDFGQEGLDITAEILRGLPSLEWIYLSSNGSFPLSNLLQMKNLEKIYLSMPTYQKTCTLYH